MKKEALAPQRTNSGGGGENRKELLFNRVFDVLVRAIKQ